MIMDSSEDTQFTNFAPAPPQVEGTRTRPVLVVMGRERYAEWVVLRERATTIGRDPRAGLSVKDDTVSRIHSVVEYSNAESADDSPECYIADNQSRNGTYLNGIKIKIRERLRNGDRINIGNTSITYFVRTDDEISSSQQIREMATIDSATGLPNRAFMLDEFAREVERAHRYGRPVSLMLMELDDFDKLVGAYPEPVSTFILQRTARLISSRIRSHDIAARSGSGEFALLMPETPLQGGLVMGERLRTTISGHVFSHDAARLHLSLSLGVAEYDAKKDGCLEALLSRAGKALDEARAAGGNRLVSG
jgi:diguanylate cyclase (GGDEF)-like protein